ncbi:phage tail tip lysozyme [Erysipelotrichaceae bacterium 66-17]
MKNKEELFIMAVVLGFIGGAAVSKSQIFANDTADSNLPQSGEEISDESDPLNTAVYIDEDKQNIEINDERETHFNKEELSTPEEPAIPGNFSNESLNIEQNETEDNLDDYYYIKNSNSIQVDSSIYSVISNDIKSTLNGVVIKIGETYNPSIKADYVILQASSGYENINPNFEKTAQQIINSGKLLAIMHEARTGIKEDGHMEAFHFYQVVKNYIGKGLPILHFTDQNAGPIWADEFMDTLYGLSGSKGIIWTTQTLYDNADWEESEKSYSITTNVTKLHMSKDVFVQKVVPNKFINSNEMYRLYNPYSGEHLYTLDKDERDNLVNIGWRYESIGWSAPKQGDKGYRLYNPYSGEHLYTLDWDEVENLVPLGWRYEGIKFYSDYEKKTEIYRLYNPYTTVGTHHFTTNKTEYDDLVRYGWRQEGIAWYGTVSSVPRNILPTANYIKNEFAYNTSRVKMTGIQTINGSLYFFDPMLNGKKNTSVGLTSVNDKNEKVYITKDGILYTGSLKIGDNYKWFDITNGKMAYNCMVNIPANMNNGIATRNYYDKDGNLLYGYYIIDGKEVWHGKDNQTLTSLDSLFIVKNDYLTLLEQQHNARIIWNYFISNGWSKNAVAALLGNMQVESNINPGLWENKEEGINNRGYGLVQWTPSNKIIEWLNKNGYSLTSGIGQCARIIWELNNGEQYYATNKYPISFREFSISQESPEYLADVFLRNYERPAEINQPKRKEYARYWYNLFAI